MGTSHSSTEGICKLGSPYRYGRLQVDIKCGEAGLDSQRMKDVERFLGY